MFLSIPLPHSRLFKKTRWPASKPLILILSILFGMGHGFIQPGLAQSPPDYSSTPGHYKDIFINAGVHLNNSFSGTIADQLGLQFDVMNAEFVECQKGDPNCVPIDQRDAQEALIVGSPIDHNGVLLYPDGAPRFRMIWVMGGLARDHGETLGGMGRTRIKTFFQRGGSYSGSCAGAFLAGNDLDWLNLWSAPMLESGHILGALPSLHQAEVPSGSPLINLPGFTFQPGQILGPIVHAGGGFLDLTHPQTPTNTEVLLTFKDLPGLPLSSAIGKPLVWAYKPNQQSGRLVNAGSHPEVANNADDLAIAKAMASYALAGQGDRQLKASLVNGRPWCLTKGTEDGDPAHTRIGDRQFHHFEVTLDQPSAIHVDLAEEPGWNSEPFDLHVYLSSNGLALPDNPNVVAFDDSAGIDKTLTTGVLPAGTYFIGVTCPNSVDFRVNDVENPYAGSTAVLNGVAYRIRATWDDQLPGPHFTNLAASYCTSANPVSLTGWPGGGIFQGPGITNGSFDPSQLEPGTYILTYTLDCAVAERAVEVVGPPSPPDNLRVLYVRPPPASTPACWDDGVPLIVDTVPNPNGYQWEVLGSKSGSFACQDQNIAIFEFAAGATSAQVRVSALSNCGTGTATEWLTITPNDP